MGWWFKIKLWQRVLAALVLGVAFGLIASNTMGQDAATSWIDTYVRPVGLLFINLIRMLIVPLIFTTLVAGVIAMGKPSKLGSLGLKTIGLYLVTTFFANVIGLTFGALFKPGAGVDLAGVEAVPVNTTPPSVTERLLEIVPTNPVAALADGDVLAIIFFSLFLGVAILSTGAAESRLATCSTRLRKSSLKLRTTLWKLPHSGCSHW